MKKNNTTKMASTIMSCLRFFTNTRINSRDKFELLRFENKLSIEMNYITYRNCMIQRNNSLQKLKSLKKGDVDYEPTKNNILLLIKEINRLLSTNSRLQKSIEALRSAVDSLEQCQNESETANLLKSIQDKLDNAGEAREEIEEQLDNVNRATDTISQPYILSSEKASDIELMQELELLLSESTDINEEPLPNLPSVPLTAPRVLKRLKKTNNHGHNNQATKLL